MLVFVVQVAEVAAFVTCAAFPALYTLGRYRGLWYRSPEGRQLVAAYSVFTGALGLRMLSVFAPDWWARWDGRPWLAAVVYLALAAVFTWQNILVIRARSRETARRRSSTQG